MKKYDDFKKDTIISSFDSRATLLKWLKKLEKAITEDFVIDSELSPTSKHAVENRVVYRALHEFITEQYIDNLFNK